MYMIASTVSSKMLQAIAKEEGFLFEVSKVHVLKIEYSLNEINWVNFSEHK